MQKPTYLVGGGQLIVPRLPWQARIGDDGALHVFHQTLAGTVASEVVRAGVRPSSPAIQRSGPGPEGAIRLVHDCFSFELSAAIAVLATSGAVELRDAAGLGGAARFEPTPTPRRAPDGRTVVYAEDIGEGPDRGTLPGPVRRTYWFDIRCEPPQRWYFLAGPEDEVHQLIARTLPTAPPGFLAAMDALVASVRLVSSHA